MQRVAAFAQQPASVCRRLCELMAFREFLQPGLGASPLCAHRSCCDAGRGAGCMVGCRWRQRQLRWPRCHWRGTGLWPRHSQGPAAGRHCVAQVPILPSACGADSSSACQLVCVPGRLLDKALQEGERNTQRVELDGHVVLVTERRVCEAVRPASRADDRKRRRSLSRARRSSLCRARLAPAPRRYTTQTTSQTFC